MTSDTSTPATGPVSGPRLLRADARRNQQRVLAAAESLFSSAGCCVPVEEIARTAGVGVGTVYRHYPDKASLLRAVVLDHLGRFVERAKVLSASGDASTALFTILRELVEWAVDKKDLKEELARAGVGPEDIHAPVKYELDCLITNLWLRAQGDGTVRADIEADDVRSLVMAMCTAADGQGPGSASRLLAVLCDGLRAHCARDQSLEA